MHPCPQPSGWMPQDSTWKEGQRPAQSSLLRAQLPLQPQIRSHWYPLSLSSRDPRSLLFLLKCPRCQAVPSSMALKVEAKALRILGASLGTVIVPFVSTVDNREGSGGLADSWNKETLDQEYYLPQQHKGCRIIASHWEPGWGNSRARDHVIDTPGQQNQTQSLGELTSQSSTS